MPPAVRRGRSARSPGCTATRRSCPTRGGRRPGRPWPARTRAGTRAPPGTRRAPDDRPRRARPRGRWCARRPPSRTRRARARRAARRRAWARLGRGAPRGTRRSPRRARGRWPRAACAARRRSASAPTSSPSATPPDLGAGPAQPVRLERGAPTGVGHEIGDAPPRAPRRRSSRRRPRGGSASRWRARPLAFDHRASGTDIVHRILPRAITTSSSSGRRVNAALDTVRGRHAPGRAVATQGVAEELAATLEVTGRHERTTGEATGVAEADGTRAQHDEVAGPREQLRGEHPTAVDIADVGGRLGVERDVVEPAEVARQPFEAPIPAWTATSSATRSSSPAAAAP